MHNILHKPQCNPSGSAPPVVHIGEQLRLRFGTGESMFRAGDDRHVYRVEHGAVCHFSDKADGRFAIIEFAFPGDFIGLGYLATHSSNAVAMLDTTVTLVSPAGIELAGLSDNRLSYMLADAGERDFDYLRARTNAVGPLAPVQRLANYLLAVLGVTRSERGSGELVIPEDITSGYVAEQLRMSVDTLAMALLSLRRSGAVDVSPRGLRVLDLARLDMVADADSSCAASPSERYRIQ